MVVQRNRVRKAGASERNQIDVVQVSLQSARNEQGDRVHQGVGQQEHPVHLSKVLGRVQRAEHVKAVSHEAHPAGRDQHEGAYLSGRRQNQVRDGQQQHEVTGRSGHQSRVALPFVDSLRKK